MLESWFISTRTNTWSDKGRYAPSFPRRLRLWAEALSTPRYRIHSTESAALILSRQRILSRRWCSNLVMKDYQASLFLLLNGKPSTLQKKALVKTPCLWQFFLRMSFNAYLLTGKQKWLTEFEAKRRVCKTRGKAPDGIFAALCLDRHHWIDSHHLPSSRIETQPGVLVISLSVPYLRWMTLVDLRHA